MKKIFILSILFSFFSLVVIGGVFALSYLKLNMTGNIDFIAYDKLIYIDKINIKNYAEQSASGNYYELKSETLEGVSRAVLRNSSSTTSVDLSGYSALQNEPIIIEIIMKSLCDTSDLYVECDYNTPYNIDIDYSLLKLKRNPTGLVENGEEQIYTIKITNTSSGTLSLSNVGITISFVEKYEIDSNGEITTTSNKNYKKAKYIIDTLLKKAYVQKANSTSSDLVVLDEVYYNEEPYKVDMLDGDSYDTGAFYSSNVKKVKFYDGIKTIGAYAFGNCSTIKSIEIPEGVTRVGTYAFSSCSNIVSINLPDTIEQIGSRAFSSCSKLVEIKLPKNITVIESYLFSSCNSLIEVIIPDGVHTIGGYAFGTTQNLKRIYIPASVATIESGFAYNAKGLEQIIVDENNEVYMSKGNCLIHKESKTLIQGTRNSIIPNDGSVTTIKSSSFSIAGLTQIDIPDSIITLQNMAFQNCSDLAVVNIGKNVNSMYMPFISCPLQKIAVHSENTKYYSINNCLIEKSTKTLVVGTSLSVIPSDGSVTKLGYSSFMGNQLLTNVVIPEGVVETGGQVFKFCENLESVTFPQSLTKTYNWDFSGCSKLKNVVFLGQVESLGESLIPNYSSVISVTFYATTPPIIKTNTFPSSISFVIYVPASSVNAYKTADVWSTYASHVQAIS